MRYRQYVLHNTDDEIHLSYRWQRDIDCDTRDGRSHRHSYDSTQLNSTEIDEKISVFFQSGCSERQVELS